MEFVSILNDVMGPVMRGPSSSHTAGSYRIGRMARSLFGEMPLSVTIRFDPEGSYGRVYRQPILRGQEEVYTKKERNKRDVFKHGLYEL